MKKRCFYCNAEIERCYFNDLDEILCENCYISDEQIERAERDLARLFLVLPRTIFEYGNDLYQVKLINFKFGKHISIPCVVKIDWYHDKLWSVNRDITPEYLNDAFSHVIDGRDLFEMLIERYKIKTIAPAQLYEKIIKNRSKIN